MALGVNIDFKDIGNKINKFFNDVINYFKHLSTDLIIAWSAVGVGLILIIVGVVII